MKKMMMLLLISVLLFAGCGEETEVYVAGDASAGEAGESPAEEPEVTDTPAPEEEAKEIPASLWVYICGAVQTPGVYELPAGSRIYHAIEAAGGMLPEAEARAVNQAQELSDGEQITIPTVEEAGELPQTASQGAVQEDAGDGRVNLNTAGIEELCTLNGIGESRAQAILDYREKNGGFQSIEELMNVDGIKEKTFEKLKESVTVG